MKKDIIIPIPEKVNLFIVPLDAEAWDIYLVNENDMSIRDVLLVTEAYEGEVQSSTLRYYIESLDSLSGAKFETIFIDVMKLKNIINITYYKAADFFHKEFIFTYEDFNPANLTHHFIVQKEGYLIS